MKFMENVFVKIFPKKVNKNILLYNLLVIFCSILFFLVSEVIISGFFALLGFLIVFILESMGSNLEMAEVLIIIIMAGLGGVISLVLSLLLLFKNLRKNR